MASNKMKAGYLKSRLDDNRLDLSLSELTNVPVKEISELKKVTQLDLSRNRLEVLPKDFCSMMTNLTELDLSSNRLRALPEKFGNLALLQRLDLYKNNISDLPLSFGNLKQLKWLDLKDNQLNENLRAVAGDFSSEKECKQAATKIVQYMKKLQSDNERERQKKMTLEREIETAKKKKDDEERKLTQQDKKKHKEEAKKRVSENAAKAKTAELAIKEKKSVKNGVKGRFENGSRSCEKESSSCIFGLLKFLFKLTMWLVIATAVVSFIVMFNCSSAYGGKFLPDSDALCNDLYHFATTGKLRVTWDYEQSLKIAVNRSTEILNHVAHEIRNFDFELWKNWAVEKLADVQRKMGPFWQLTRTYLESCFLWALNFIKIWAQVTYQSLVIIAINVGYLAVQTFEWVVINGRHFIDNCPAYWQQLKVYWYNLK